MTFLAKVGFPAIELAPVPTDTLLFHLCFELGSLNWRHTLQFLNALDPHSLQFTSGLRSDTIHFSPVDFPAHCIKLSINASTQRNSAARLFRSLNVCGTRTNRTKPSDSGSRNQSSFPTAKLAPVPANTILFHLCFELGSFRRRHTLQFTDVLKPHSL